MQDFEDYKISKSDSETEHTKSAILVPQIVQTTHSPVRHDQDMQVTDGSQAAAPTPVQQRKEVKEEPKGGSPGGSQMDKRQRPIHPEGGSLVGGQIQESGGSRGGGLGGPPLP